MVMFNISHVGLVRYSVQKRRRPPTRHIMVRIAAFFYHCKRWFSFVKLINIDVTWLYYDIWASVAEPINIRKSQERKAG